MKWSDYFYYNDGKLFRKKQISSKSKVGEEVGYICKGYLRLYHEGRSYSVHRIIWEVAVGRIPDGYVIDHIDHNTINNNIHNLRCVKRIDNQRNMKRRIDNTSGCVGVYWHKAAGKWMASIGVNGKSKYIGLFDSVVDAVNAREDKQKEMNFHENHGGDYV